MFLVKEKKKYKANTHVTLACLYLSFHFTSQLFIPAESKLSVLILERQTGKIKEEEVEEKSKAASSLPVRV